MAGNAGSVESAATLLGKHKDNAELCLACLQLIELLITQNDLNRDKLKDPLSKPRIATIVETLNALADDAAIQEVGFKVAKLGATKSESIKVSREQALGYSALVLWGVDVRMKAVATIIT